MSTPTTSNRTGQSRPAARPVMSVITALVAVALLSSATQPITLAARPGTVHASGVTGWDRTAGVTGRHHASGVAGWDRTAGVAGL